LREDSPQSRTNPLTFEVLKRAERLGTLNQVDRRPQYLGQENAKPEALLKGINELGNHIRGTQKDLGQVQHQLYNLKLRNAIIVAVVTALLMKAPDLVTWLSRFFQ
jgi:hypothetical protein